MHIDSKLVSACLSAGDTIRSLTHNGQRVHGGRLLLTISGLESSFGTDRLFVRMEAGYAPGGKYYESSDVLKGLWKTFGCMAASSYGSFQLMFPTARELGYTGAPIDLQKDEICAYWASRLIIDRFITRQGATTLEHVLDAYNSGTYRDRVIPQLYIDRGLQMYADLVSY